MYAVKLNFKSPVHLGEEGLGMEEASLVLHSDTLYCALYSAWQELFTIEGELPVRLSSAYPYVENTFYFPKPGLPAPGFEDLEKRNLYAKDVKRASFIDLDTFQSWINGKAIDFERVKESNNQLSKKVNSTIRPRVTLDRITCNSGLYYIGEVHYDGSCDCGLYYLAEADTENWGRLQKVMVYLGEVGIGGEKSSGYGRFIPSFIDNFQPPFAEEGDRYLTLSLLLPGDRDEAKQAYSYRLIRRGGWSMDTPHLKVHMFTEGSIFSAPVEGKIAIVADVGHPVFRCGRSFLVKVR